MKPKNPTKPTSRQSLTSAKEKIWKEVKHLHIDGDKTKPSKLPTGIGERLTSQANGKKKDMESSKAFTLRPR